MNSEPIASFTSGSSSPPEQPAGAHKRTHHALELSPEVTLTLSDDGLVLPGASSESGESLLETLLTNAIFHVQVNP